MTTLRSSLNPDSLREFLSDRAVQTSAVIAALLLFAASLAQWTWRLWSPSPSPVVQATGAGASSVDLSVLATTNPFGPAGAAAESPAMTGDLARTSLNLVLTGVMLRHKGGCALLSVDGAPEAAFCVGEEILPGVRLDSVYGDRAVIARNGVRELVLLKEPEGGSIAAAGLNSSGPAVPIVQSIGPRRHLVARRELEQAMNRPEFLSQALIVPNPGGAGFLVREVQSGSLYEQLGLRPGDVIRAVNGQTLQSVDQVMRLYRQFGAMGRFVVEIQRQGRSESLSYDMR